MSVINSNGKYKYRSLNVLIACAIGYPFMSWASGDYVEFNTEVLDVADRNNVDLSKFSRVGYILPGVYNMTIYVNNAEVISTDIKFLENKNDEAVSSVCLTTDVVEKFGLKHKVSDQLKWDDERQCLNVDSLEGMTVRPNLASSAVYISIPQAYLEYVSESWDPPSRWDEGIAGILFDYSFNAQARNTKSNDTLNVSGNGTSGFNIGAWRFRADWQSRYIRTDSGNAQTNFDWSRYYAYRALPKLQSSLTIGEDYLTSDLFDSVRFTGASLRSDDSMIPPNLRGYAPEVTGTAKTDAKVTVMQKGRVLYESQVAAGPFRIQELSDAVSGELEVRVEEQDGSIQQFTVNTANVPYLTRPGKVRYKLSAGQPGDWDHKGYGPIFGSGEFSWGIKNGWSLYGGLIAGGEYNSVAVGTGRDLLSIGVVSADIIQSHARIPSDENLSGRSYRISYSKDFDKYDSKFTFSGYRFSEKDYLSMSDYLSVRQGNVHAGRQKEMYSATINKNFRDLRLSTYINYDHKTYWNQPDNDRYSMMVSRYFDVGSLRNLSVTAQLYRTRYNGANDDGMYLTMSMPWGNRGSVNYNANVSGNKLTQTAGYYDRIDERRNYQLKAGTSDKKSTVSAFYNRDGDAARLSATAAYQEGNYSSLGIMAQGGMTLTGEGGALHRTGTTGGTRLLLDTDGISGVPVRANGGSVKTNAFGKAVTTDVNSYYRNQARIDIDKLDGNVEATTSVVRATLTQGAIGYRQFGVIGGVKALARIRLADGSAPPFGARVSNSRNQETGLVGDDGSVYLSGVTAGHAMTVSWNNSDQCEIQIPNELPQDELAHSLLLPCHITV